MRLNLIAVVCLVTVLAACTQTSGETAAASKPDRTEPIPAGPPMARESRLSGIVEAVHSVRIVVPPLTGQNNRVTLTRLIANGSHVEVGDSIAEFDPLEQMDAARAARGKQEDLDQQVQQKAAQNRADQEKRRSDLQAADSDLRKALLEVSKAEILPDINKQQNNVRAKQAQLHLDSLKISQAHHDKSEAAAVRILELQRDRQKVALERAQANIENLVMKAPIAGMVAHSVQYRQGSVTHVQVGDQLTRGTGLVSIFDPSEMLVRCSVGEPDRVELQAGARALVYLDAYPDLALPAHFEGASPIATAVLGTPIKTFTALFKLEKTDPRLMPDLSAAVVLEKSTEKRK
ncbi:MAG: HlyD family efflux transporter periplasmic adaptor subunit [Acidobacteriota bacterium]